jgi:hypothetical protein
VLVEAVLEVLDAVGVVELAVLLVEASALAVEPLEVSA